MNIEDGHSRAACLKQGGELAVQNPNKATDYKVFDFSKENAYATCCVAFYAGVPHASSAIYLAKYQLINSLYTITVHHNFVRQTWLDIHPVCGITMLFIFWRLSSFATACYI